jgi:sterol desaturase/sphingolipid hydroxylase (fatty acid hydroxylase superfamily)
MVFFDRQQNRARQNRAGAIDALLMKVVLSLFLVIGLTLIGFCGWGMFTASGQTAFSEMAGLLPFYAGTLGSAIVLLTGLVYVFYRRRSHDHRL